MNAHDIDYKIIGDDIQLVEIELDPGETVIAEAGSMMYMEDDINYDTRLGDGSQASQSVLNKIISAGSRVLTGESLFVTHFTNKGRGKRKVAFSAPYPGKIVPIELNEFGNSLIVQNDAFLCAALGTKISLHFNRRLGSGLVGGEGFVLQRLDGNGRAFIHSGGTIVKRQLNNETLRVDTGCIVGFTEGIDFNVKAAGNLRSMVFGGEGLFLATLQGVGTVWLQSMPIRKLVRALSPYGKNTRKEGRSLLEGFLE